MKSQRRRAGDRAIIFWAVVVLGVLAGEPAAFAKGPSQGVVEGPGILAPITLRGPGEPTIGPDLAAVAQKSGFFVGLWCRTCDSRLVHRPEQELGPRYTVTYTLRRPGGFSMILQYVFPYAVPRPVTYMPPDQRFWEGNVTVGGWYVARAGLRRTLIDLGIPKKPLEAWESSVAEAESATHSGAQPDAGPLSLPTEIAAAVAALAAGATFVWRLRRRDVVVTHRPDSRSGA